MTRRQTSLHRLAGFMLGSTAFAMALMPAATAQSVRTKKPDRGTYVSPRQSAQTLSRRSAEPARRLTEVVVEQPRLKRVPASTAESLHEPSSLDALSGRVAEEERRRGEGLRNTSGGPREPAGPSPKPRSSASTLPKEGELGWLKGVGETPRAMLAHPGDAELAQASYVNEVYESIGCGCEEVGCDGIGCQFEAGCGFETIGCDSIGCDGCSGCRPTGDICFAPHRWFGSLDLMLMFRSGDHLPPLVTTGPSNDPDLAGQLGQTGTTVLTGDRGEFEDVTVGGRLVLGTWLDDCQQRSLRLRGWIAAEQSFGFSADESDFDVLARPFFDVSDGITPTQDTQLIAFPARSFGSVRVDGDSNVHGADIAIYQPWVSGFAGTVDVLYGYQYMRLDEALSIGSTATSLDDDFAPVGAVIDIQDSFDAENDFHGGQVGLATRVQEGCWSFNGLLKVGFGSLRRQAIRSGRTLTSIDGANAIDDQGLLVRDSNRGRTTDHTFGWVPELDASIGWHRFPRFDVKVGYHVIAMTDALQVSGAIDPNLAVNLADPPTGAQNPSGALRFDTFYVHGVHFGLQYSY